MLTHFECLLILVKQEMLMVSNGGITTFQVSLTSLLLDLKCLYFPLNSFNLFYNNLMRNDPTLPLTTSSFQLLISDEINDLIDVDSTYCDGTLREYSLSGITNINTSRSKAWYIRNSHT